MKTSPWYEISNVAEIDSPALLIYPDRAEENVRRMISMAGGPQRLRPHVKTHKLPEMVRMQMALGITKFKCATIAEAEMVADCGVLDVLLAYQPVGPKAQRLLQLIKKFPRTSFSTIVDDAGAIRALSDATVKAGAKIKVLLDIDCGMHRSGVPAGPKAVELYRLMASLPGLEPYGLHLYDGHIEDSDIAVRTKRCDEAFAPVAALRRELSGLPVPLIVAGGSPTFPIHARRPDVECSPGTCVFWDTAYGDALPDLDFLHAALVLTRVVGKPGGNRLCLDLGHKAVAAEKPQPRVTFLNLPDAQPITHSEEHLVVETSRAGEISVGDCFYGIPKHVCPTVALHAEAVVIKNGKAEVRWKIAARARMLSI
ncbi:MAG TPA: D-TA family PLP-dependent enzyme [Verrucomicrobiae bacterium]|jgi:D-serine deaminase-like pyridoxal phosphate-dependent protein|nr:D-TA family PLP-dependent enzyme [Verrucomicrobiae bacterium]